jgi:large subunit ribosomal protein L15
MKLHDLRPAPGSHKKKTRVGRGIAGGKGKTAGRGTKGQKARAGGKIPAWFEGGQTPLHVRIPKLRGFRNPFKIEYEIVNVGGIAHLVEMGVLEAGDMPGARKSKDAPAPITVNQEILRAAGLVRSLNTPMKVLGHGDLPVAIFLVADAVSTSARAKIEAAGGTVSLLEVPTRPLQALGVTDEADEAAVAGPAVAKPEVRPAKPEAKPRAKKPAAKAAAVAPAVTDEAPADESPAEPISAAETETDVAEASADDDLASDATGA